MRAPGIWLTYRQHEKPAQDHKADMRNENATVLGMAEIRRGVLDLGLRLVDAYSHPVVHLHGLIASMG